MYLMHMYVHSGYIAGHYMYMNLSLAEVCVNVHMFVLIQTAQLPPEPFRLRHNIVMRSVHTFTWTCIRCAERERTVLQIVH